MPEGSLDLGKYADMTPSELIEESMKLKLLEQECVIDQAHAGLEIERGKLESMKIQMAFDKKRNSAAVVSGGPKIVR